MTHDPNWEAEVNGKILISRFNNELSNVFEIPKGNYEMVVKYKVEDYKVLGIKLAQVAVYAGFLLILIENKKRVIESIVQ